MLALISHVPRCPNSGTKCPRVLELVLSSLSTWSRIACFVSLYPSTAATSFPTSHGSPSTQHVVQTASITAVDVFNDAIPEQSAVEEANNSFIQQGCKCHFCGRESHWGTEYIVTIEGGYNSDHDMEMVSVDVCAGCLETMLAAVN